eukprot:1781369-Amphidinium_carterae.1
MPFMLIHADRVPRAVHWCGPALGQRSLVEAPAGREGAQTEVPSCLSRRNAKHVTADCSMRNVHVSM